MIRLRGIGKIPGAIASWLGERFELEDSVMAVLRHPVPRELERPVGWWYVLGSATLAIFVMQVVTGVGLAMTWLPGSRKPARCSERLSRLRSNVSPPWWDASSDWRSNRLSSLRPERREG